MTADDPVSPIPVGPDGLSRREQWFIQADGIRLRWQDIRHYRDAWTGDGIPAAEIEWAANFHDRWGRPRPPASPTASEVGKGSVAGSHRCCRAHWLDAVMTCER